MRLAKGICLKLLKTPVFAASESNTALRQTGVVNQSDHQKKVLHIF
ncbi:hypothetical protein SD78_4078 [Bacillus badius]|nr:hypothetical protein SD78_4078 [Bacillus badius]